MPRSQFLPRTLAVLAILIGASASAYADSPTRIFLLHNSVGRLLIEEGGMREHLDQHNAQHQTQLKFWDHNYPYIGVSDAEGRLLGYPYSSICGHDTEPDGLHMLWTDETIDQYVDARDSILTMHDVIAFKSCYRGIDFGGARTEAELDAALAQYKAWYLEMRDVFDRHPDKIFVALSIPPRHRLHEEATPARAARGRLFAEWLKSPEFLGSPARPNLRVFDLFDLLAAPADGSPGANMLRYDYERSHYGDDSHPNALGCSIVGPLLMQYLIDATGGSLSAVGRVPQGLATGLQAHPNPFNPATTLSFELAATEQVTLEILDIRGRRVQVLVSGVLGAGVHEFSWNGRDLQGQPVGSGVFVGYLKAGERVAIQRLTLIK
ncbi:MAG: hypothetical protein IH621_17690 [Krumholzibacteria bacterium]|nr:hypothetical protein [Candidatus Krumholzibacteria bacterium]